MRITSPRERERAVHDRFQTGPPVEAFEPMLAKTLDHRVLFFLRARLDHRSFDLQVTVKDLLQLSAYLTPTAKNADLNQPAAIGERGHSL